MSHLRYPPQFRTVPFGCYSNQGFRPYCYNDRTHAVAEKWRAAVSKQQFYQRELLLATLSATPNLASVEQELQRHAHALADFFAPRYGLPIREAVYQLQSAHSAAYSAYLRALVQNNRRGMDDAEQALYSIAGELTQALVSVHSDPVMIGQLLNSDQRDVLFLTLRQAEAEAARKFDSSLSLFNETVERALKGADTVYKAFLA